MIKITRFTASWCQPCKILAPIFGELQNEVSGVSFETVDVDYNKDKASQYSVWTNSKSFFRCKTKNGYN